MYFYRFQHQFEEQSVVFSTNTIKNIAEGSIIQDNNEYFLCLGEEISWAELVHNRHAFTNPKAITTLSPVTIQQIHRMVYERFSTYKHIIQLYLGSDLDLLLKHQQKTIPQHKSQILHIFPTLFALVQYQKEYFPDSNDILLLSGQTTSIQRAKAYRLIKNGKIKTIVATHSQIFWDRNHLGDIQFHDPYSPLYETHQEPRYNVSMIVKEMKKSYHIL